MKSGGPGIRYAPFYCEENVYLLCAARRAAGEASTVLLVTNPERTCAVWNQLAAPAAGQPIVWDYHLLLLARSQAVWQAWDLDTRLAPRGTPLPFREYAARTFALPGRLPPRLEPRFRVIEGEAFLAEFSSDRSHMRTRRGRYRKRPPPWPPILKVGMPGFLTWLDEGGPGPGRWLSLPALLDEFSDPAG